MAIVGRPYASAFGCEGSVAEVKRERGIRIVEFDPVLGWYNNDPWICRPRRSSGRGDKRGD